MLEIEAPMEKDIPHSTQITEMHRSHEKTHWGHNTKPSAQNDES